MLYVQWAVPLVLVVVAMVGVTTTTGLVSPILVSKGGSVRLVSPSASLKQPTASKSMQWVRFDVRFGPTGRTKWTMTAQAATAASNEEYSRQQPVDNTATTATTITTTATTLSHEEIARYSRHLVLDAVGVKGQEALRNASVLVIGAGGLGSPVLLYLAAAGIGRIGIVDGDTVDTSNLQRQIIHSMSSVGLTKCESAQQRIAQINPHVQVRRYEYEFTAATAHDILAMRGM
jgi:ThiF family